MSDEQANKLSDHPDSSTRWEIVVFVLMMVGQVMVITALPLGAATGFQDYSRNAVYWAIVLGFAVTLCLALLGAILDLTGRIIGRRIHRGEQLLDSP